MGQAILRYHISHLAVRSRKILRYGSGKVFNCICRPSPVDFGKPHLVRACEYRMNQMQASSEGGESQSSMGCNYFERICGLGVASFGKQKHTCTGGRGYECFFSF
jgi:hypothetical protein